MAGNLKAHKKYFLAMQEFPDSIIITVDDDVIYPITLVSSLVKSFKKHPNCISARLVHRIFCDDKGLLMPYKKWQHNCTQYKNPRFDLLAVGVGGILYPPHILPKEAFEIDSIRKLSLNADDIWLKFMELKNSIPVVWAHCYITHPPIIEGTQNFALGKTSINDGANDILVANLVNKYPESIAKITNLNFLSQ